MKTEVIRLRIESEEKKYISDLAKKSGLSLSDYVRVKVLGKSGSGAKVKEKS